MSTSSRPWWSSRWAGGGALALAPLGAFVGLVAAVLAYQQVDPALVGYLFDSDRAVVEVADGEVRLRPYGAGGAG